MSLRNCGECGGQVSTNARACPSCGNINRGSIEQGCRTGCLLTILGPLLFFLFLLLMGGGR